MKIPKTGYVGVGIVLESVQSVNDFKVQTPEGERRKVVVTIQKVEFPEMNKRYVAIGSRRIGFRKGSTWCGQGIMGSRKTEEEEE